MTKDELALIGERFIKATYSHVDGRDLLSELKPKHWHFCNIVVRINGRDVVYEGDWLKNLLYARDGGPEYALKALDKRNLPEFQGGWSVILSSLQDKEKGGPI